MTSAAHLWAVGYDDMGRAAQVRDEIIKLGATHCLILLDTAVVVRYPDGSLTLDGERFVVIPKARGNSLANFLVGLALSVPPLSATAVGALESATGRSTSAGVGISEEFVGQVEGLIKPGTSALFVLDQEGESAAILRGIRGLGGTVLKTSVDLKQALLIQSTLAAATAGGE
jgi:uncharacterized membrane protein